ncbi:MAG: PAS domain S-box protein, partial [Woeseia sp.]
MAVEGAPDETEEERRLAALRRYGVLDTPADRAYDDITEIAAAICNTPISLISLVDKDRQWFKSHKGLSGRETHRKISFCAHAIHSDEILEIPDTLEDERFRSNPLVTDAPHIRFYSGAPLITNDGFRLGTVCVIDRQPRILTLAQHKVLQALARQVVNQLELQFSVDEVTLAREKLVREAAYNQRLEAARQRSEEFMSATLNSVSDTIAIVDAAGTIVHVNSAWSDFAAQNSPDEIASTVGVGANYLRVCDKAAANGEDVAAKIAGAIRNARNRNQPRVVRAEYPCFTPDEDLWFVASVTPFVLREKKYSVVCHHDITRRKQAEVAIRDANAALEQRVRERTDDLESAIASLHSSEERFRSLLDNASAGAIVVNTAGRLAQVNDAWCRMAGHSAHEMLGRELEDFVHPADRRVLKASVDSILCQREEVVE